VRLALSPTLALSADFLHLPAYSSLSQLLYGPCDPFPAHVLLGRVLDILAVDWRIVHQRVRADPLLHPLHRGSLQRAARIQFPRGGVSSLPHHQFVRKNRARATLRCACKASTVSAVPQAPPLTPHPTPICYAVHARIWQALRSLGQEFKGAATAADGLLAVNCGLLTAFLLRQSSAFRTKRYLSARMREAISDFGPPAVILGVSALSLLPAVQSLG
jgi:hypothetical protein